MASATSTHSISERDHGGFDHDKKDVVNATEKSINTGTNANIRSSSLEGEEDEVEVEDEDEGEGGVSRHEPGYEYECEDFPLFDEEKAEEVRENPVVWTIAIRARR
ncbi:hypothetical protein IFR05_010776 [Cadophora sp. M221]|nr:hypothetical protein IFR05_010776 [Cadophora sp. M221]